MGSTHDVLILDVCYKGEKVETCVTFYRYELISMVT